MKKSYIVTRAERESASVIQQFCQANGQILLPIVEMIQSASEVVTTVMHELGRQTLETILMLSAEQIAGAKTPGKARGDIRWHGSQPGHVNLADRKVKVKRPRLRHKTDGEVKVPAYEALRNEGRVGEHMLNALMRGLSTRQYNDVLPAMAATVGVSRSAVSRQAAEASAEQLKQLQERRWDEVDILVIYIDGQRFGENHILSAVGVDTSGRKHILGIECGATENAAAVKRLLTHLREHGLPTDRKYLFVIDGAKALRAAIDEVFGAGQAVQRCRNHKLRNVLDELPEDQQGQALNLFGQPGRSGPRKRARNAWSNWPALSSVTTNQPPAASVRECPRCSPSSACRSLRRFTSAWRRPTLSRVRKAVFRSARATSLAGAMPIWCNAGSPQLG